MKQVHDLESAILNQARRLAAEYLQRAKQSRDNILREANERLRLREEREVLVAKAMADRLYRRTVQASELKLQKEMDHLRWALVRDVEDRLLDRAKQLAKDEETYLPLLQQFLAQGGKAIPADELVAEVNSHDHERIAADWEKFALQAAPEKRVLLSRDPIECSGGVLIRSRDNRVRIDNTFEGRLERLRDPIRQVIVERLLVSAGDQGTLFQT